MAAADSYGETPAQVLGLRLVDAPAKVRFLLPRSHGEQCGAIGVSCEGQRLVLRS